MNEAASLRQLWPQVLEALRPSKVTWAILQDTHVVGVEGRLVQIGFGNPALRDRFSGSPREETVREVLRQLTGAEWKIDALVAPSVGTPMAGSPGAGFPPAFAAAGPMPTGSSGFGSAAPAQPVGFGVAAAASGGQSAQQPSAGPHAFGHATPMSATSSAPASSVSAPPVAQPATAPEDDEPDPDDEDVDDAGPTAQDLLVRELGATVLEERSDADY